MSDVSWLWHQKLSHPNFWFINELVTIEIVRGLPLLKFDNDTLCPYCECGQQAKGSHPMIIDSSIYEPLQLLHIILCGPSKILGLHHKKYIVHVVDAYTHFTWIFILRLKSESP